MIGRRACLPTCPPSQQDCLSPPVFSPGTWNILSKIGKAGLGFASPNACTLSCNATNNIKDFFGPICVGYTYFKVLVDGYLCFA